jgi:alkanesulfonate monooxygenase SsuD/methylene tetrahydromethanopterin reductase-like flavin-dependent oxidoreductase (luciferase family)
MRDLAVVAEQTGRDSIWVADHLLFASADGQTRGAWESLSMLAALAETTRKMELGPLVMCTPFRNPGLIAWMANTLDEISGGRFVLGMGAGWHEPEFSAFGFEFDHRVSLFADSLEVVVPLVREGRVAYEGRWAKGNAELRPPGPRPNGPPILIAGSRPRMMSLIARWADRWNSVWYGLPTEEFHEERANLEEACRHIGRDAMHIEVSAGIVVQPQSVTRQNGPDALAGTVEQIAEGLGAWRDEGVDEVMCRLEPPSAEMIETIGQAVSMLDQIPRVGEAR